MGLKKVVYMGGKEVGYRCFLFLLENSEKLGIEIIALFFNESRLNQEKFNAVDLANRHGIPIYDDLDSLTNLNDVDYILSVQYHKILRRDHINVANVLAVNLHMAPLPEYRGCNQFSYALIDQARLFGTTLHVLDEKIDGGDIIAEDRFEIPEGAFVKDLYRQTVERSVALFELEIGNIVKGDFKVIPQKELMMNRGASFHLRSDINEINVIHDNWDAEKKKLYFRATYFPPFEPPKLLRNGELISTSMEWYNSL